MVKISVIMATFNAEEVLPDAMQAFRSQTHAGKELLIADGGSLDGTVDIIKDNCDLITWSCSERDHGIFDAWNKCLEHADGEWIYFMGADDIFANNEVLAAAASKLSKLPSDVLVAYGAVNLTDSDGRPVDSVGGPWNSERFRHEGMTIPHQGTFTRAKYFSIYGGFDSRQKQTATYELYLRHLAKNDAVFFPSFVVGNMGIGGVSTRPENQLRFMISYIRAQVKHNTFKITPRLLFYCAQAVIKSAIFKIFPPKISVNIIENLRTLAGKKRHYRT